MKRTFKYVAVASGGTPQPVFGTTLSAAVTARGDTLAQSIPVVDSSWFHDKDWIVLDPKNATAAKRETLQIMQVVDATHISVVGMQYNHANGVFVQLAIPCLEVYIECKIGNAGTVFIGNNSAMVTATGVFVISQLVLSAAGVTPAIFKDTDYGLANVMKSDDYWFDGTTGDNILPSLTVI